MAGFARKGAWLAELAPDIAIISEVTRDAFNAVADANGAWTGRDGVKGLAIFGRNGWCIETIHVARYRHVLAVTATRGDDGFTIIGVWSSPLKGDYVTPIARGLAELSKYLTGAILIAGDFNANPIWDGRRPPSRQFASIVRDLAARGIASIWHDQNREEHGAEGSHTYFHQLNEQQPFHIDYVFASEGLRRRVKAIQIGSYADWVATRRSDHVPVAVDFAPNWPGNSVPIQPATD
jgi:exodeoxyribonuclease-3